MVRDNRNRRNERPQQDHANADALRLLNAMIRDFQHLIDPDQRTTTKMVYTHGVVLWMLVLQRLGGGLSLNDVVSHLLNHDPELLPDNRRVREHTLSDNSSAYSQGRKRLPLQTIIDFSHGVCDHLASISPLLIDGRRVFLLDGTTVTLAPTPALQEAFPPATNQFGSTVWPVAQLMVANELQSGCALLPQVDPMYGENNASEAVQASRIVTQLPPGSIVMADSGFGIFSVAHHTVEAGHDFLFRLTKSRFKAMRRKAVLIAEGAGYKTYHLHWQPSAKDRKSLPDVPAEASLDVVLHEVDIAEDKTLYLVTSLELDGPTCGTLYRRRYDVEFDIRDFKVTLDAENIRAKSVEMFQKELYASVVAYNLVAQFRRQAAQLGRVEPRRLSFKGVWTCLRDRLLLQQSCSFEEWLDRYAMALQRASQKKHPHRKSPRSYPRKAHPRRPKTTKFIKSQRKNKQPEDPPTTHLATK
ncbi:MAG: IS4 family transposase [Shimia sp.]|nr:IS4 family transposase [Shimia sp.]